MLQRATLRALRPLSSSASSSLCSSSVTRIARRYASAQVEVDPNVTDPGMNGGYPQLAPIKRQHRDPYGDWWDKQDRRNFGEPVHEDNDILGIFTTEDYTWTTPGWGAVLVGCFIATFGGVLAVVYQYYPDKPSAPRRFEGGLEKELGGPNAVRVSLRPDSASTMLISRRHYLKVTQTEPSYLPATKI